MKFHNALFRSCIAIAIVTTIVSLQAFLEVNLALPDVHKAYRMAQEKYADDWDEKYTSTFKALYRQSHQPGCMGRRSRGLLLEAARFAQYRLCNFRSDDEMMPHLGRRISRILLRQQERHPPGFQVRSPVLSCVLQMTFTSDELLHWSMQTSYFGKGKFGAQQATRAFFGKTLSETSIAQQLWLLQNQRHPGRDMLGAAKRARRSLQFHEERGILTSTETRTAHAELTQMILAAEITSGDE